MARRKPGNLRSLTSDISKSLTKEEVERPWRETRGGEAQSELYPSSRPAAPASSRPAPRAKPSAGGGGPTRRTPPLPPRRPSTPPKKTGPTYPVPYQDQLTTTGGIPPFVPGTGPILPPIDTGVPGGLPGDNRQQLGALPTGPAYQPGQGPPLTGPAADRMSPLGPLPGPQAGPSVGIGDIAGGIVPPPIPQGASVPPSGGFADWAARQNAMPPPPPTPGIGQGPPLAGPGSDRAAAGPTQLGGLGSLPEGQSAAGALMAPQGLLGGVGDYLRKLNTTGNF